MEVKQAKDKENQIAEDPANQGENVESEVNINKNRPENNDVASQVGEVLRGDTGAIKEIYEKTRESGEQAAEQAIDSAKQRASNILEQQKTTLATGLHQIAGEFRQIGSNLQDTDGKNLIVGLTAKFGESVAGKFENVSTYLEKKNMAEIIKDTKSFARQNPSAFVGGAFVLGFLAARIIKSSTPNSSDTR